MTFEYKDKTALVTGASSGIGEAFCRELAKRGMHLIIAARSEDLLHKLAGELSEAHNIRVDVFAVDLSDEDGIYNTIDACVEMDRPIDLLINNAGFGNVGAYEKQDQTRERDMVMVNSFAVAQLCHAFIPPMAERGFGGVINVASIAGYQPLPHLATYAATKAFVKSLSNSLWAEFKGRGVHIMELSPGPVATNFVNATDSKAMNSKTTAGFMKVAMTPEKLVQKALASFDAGKPRCIPGQANQLMTAMGNLVPDSLIGNVVALGMKKLK
jgi:short-subunit dehydrogenase